MKILILTTEFLPYLGGVGSHTYYLSKGLSQLGHSVSIITRNYKNQIDDQNKIDIQLEMLNISCFRLEFKKKLFILTWRKKIREFLKQNVIDLCIINNDGAQVVMSHHSISRLLKKYVVIVHGMSISKFIDNSNVIYKLFFNNKNILKLFRSSTRIIAVSTSIKTLLIDTYSFKNISVVKNCIDTDTFYYEDNFEDHKKNLKRKYRISAQDKILMSASRLLKHKGQDILINVFKKIQSRFPHTKLIICGDGINKKNLENQVSELKLTDKVIFTGQINHNELRDFYQLSDLFVLLSKKEPFGLVFLEANACKTPVVGSNIDGIPDAVKHKKSGFLVNPYDINECVTTISALLENKELRTTIGKQGYDRVQNRFTENNLAKNIITSSKNKL